jgi:predicted nucleotidyltransferase
MKNALHVYRESREELLSRIVKVLSNDERFVAAWLMGSYSRNNADAVSDLDLNVVVSDSYSENLCRKVEQLSPQTTEERLNLFSQFGTPAIIHENNYNAPEGGTFTFTLYAKSRLMVDWILIPQSQASRPSPASLLFEKSGIPVAPPIESESDEQRVIKASERVAFFWMMMAITAKYLIRRDSVFVIQWSEELCRIVQEVERLLAGTSWEYVRGSRSVLEPTIKDQKQALFKLGEKMESLIPELKKMGGQVLPSPMGEIKALLDLAQDE